MACLSLGVGVWSATAQQKEFKEVIRKNVSLANTMGNSLVVKNVFGSVTVEGYSGNEVVLEVERIITADNTGDLEQGKEDTH